MLSDVEHNASGPLELRQLIKSCNKQALDLLLECDWDSVLGNLEYWILIT